MSFCTDMTVREYTQAALRLARPTPVVDIDLDKARGLVLAQEMRSPSPLPLFDNSAMDGYAVRHQDLVGRQGAMPVCAEIPAGPGWPAPLPPGTAAPIMTGAAVPQGADTIVQVEWTQRAGDGVLIHRLPPCGANIRRRGGEVAVGDLVARSNTELTSTLLAAMAALGCSTAWVYRQPHVAVLSTGCELVTPGHHRPRGGVHDANSALLQGLLLDDGAAPTAYPIQPDEASQVQETMVQAAATHDLVLSAGGISAGTHEVVKLALVDQGVRFHRVAMAPGGPQGLGFLGSTPVITLPGNPAAALVSYALFVKPVIRTLRGLAAPEPPWFSARATAPVERRANSTRMLPAALKLQEGISWGHERGDAHQLSHFAQAGALMRIEPGPRDMRAGEMVQVLRL